MNKYLVQIKMAAIFFVILIAAGNLHAQENQRMVFAHYMVGMPMYGDPASATVADLKKDIVDASDQGINAFQINIHDWSESDARQVTARLYQAASECKFPFYLFPSVDYNENDGTRWLYEDIYDYMRLYAEHPNQLLVNDRPFFTSWLGQLKGVDFWRNIKESLHKELGLDIYYVPFHAITCEQTSAQVEAYLDKWDDVIDGYFSWGASRPPFFTGPSKWATTPEANENMSAALLSRGLSYMTPIIPAFWATCKLPCKYTEHQGAKGMKTQWMSIINNQTANWVNLVTWNDLGEDSHWSPHPNPNRSTQEGPVWTHAGYAELNKYYIQWWKSGQQPPIDSDKLFYFYRNQFQDAIPLNASCPQECNRHIPDKVYVTTMLTRPATLTIKSGAKITVHDIPAGIHNWEGELGVGNQCFTIIRDDKVVLEATGGVTVDNTPEYKSWSLYSGFAGGKPTIRSDGK